MIEIPRALARQFRAVLRRSVMEGRSDWPLVLCRTEESGLTLEAKQGDVAVRFERDGRHESAAIAFRASVLAEFEGRADMVTLEQTAFGKGRACWTDGGVPRVFDFDTVLADSSPAFPSLPKRFRAQPIEFLHAFDEAARTTARESGRSVARRSGRCTREVRSLDHRAQAPAPSQPCPGKCGCDAAWALPLNSQIDQLHALQFQSFPNHFHPRGAENA